MPIDGHDGRSDTLDQLVPIVYEELRAVARRQLRRRDQDATLSSTGLVHEAYLKLSAQNGRSWRDRPHFLALASMAMRHILIDRAKARMTLKRDRGARDLTLDEDQIPEAAQPEALLELNAVVDELSASEPRLGQVIECRFFGGLTEKETAEALGMTTRTVQRDWAKARMLLRRALSPSP